MHAKKAFTMIELVFVIVVLGILASIAIPKFAATRTDAKISAARATIAAVRSGIINKRQTLMLTGQGADCSSIALGSQFANVLSYPAKEWSGSGTSFSVKIDGTTCNFAYDKTNCTFTLSSGGGVCNNLDI